MTADKTFALKLSGRELESVRDLVDSRASSIISDDKEAGRERRLLLGIVEKIEGLGPTRAMIGQRDPIAPTRRGPRTPGRGKGGAA